MATASERQAQFRQRHLDAGSKREAFWLEPQALSALARLRSLHPGTRDQIVNQALIALLETNSVKPLNAADSVLETNSNAPVDRAELAAIAREWRCEGLTLEQVATRLNEAGWTPSAIPAKRTTADSWTAKTLSQLLNRDCKAGE